MKSAKEWVWIYSDGLGPIEATEPIIHAIQRDALLHAAGIAEKAQDNPHDPTTSMMQGIVARAIKRAIQAEADKLKP